MTGLATLRDLKYKSLLEGDYALHLEGQRRRGEILQWDYEPESLKLADGSRYTPDFRVVLPDRTIEFHETKGFMREAALVRLKVAARLHPYVFKLVTRRQGGFNYTTI